MAAGASGPGGAGTGSGSRSDTRFALDGPTVAAPLRRSPGGAGLWCLATRSVALGSDCGRVGPAAGRRGQDAVPGAARHRPGDTLGTARRFGHWPVAASDAPAATGRADPRLVP